MKIVIILLGISISINAVLFVAFQSRSEKNASAPPLYPSEYPLLSSRIFTEHQNDLLINFVPLRTAMNNYLDNIDHPIGVYFEYLPTGTSIGINDRYEARLASLIKIPIVMAIYKQIEAGTLTEDTVITIQKSDLNNEFGDLWKRGEGTQLTVREAISLALVESDNTSAKALTRLLTQGAIDNVFDSLDIPKDRSGGLPVISPKNYSSILRSLYLAAYLNKDHSSEILELLSKTNFKDRIAKDVSEQITIAHKIGVYNQPNQQVIFSDCGIFYIPKRPYILCIMANTSEVEANKHMSYISKMIYGYIVAVNK